MSEYYRADCEEWAKGKLKDPRFKGKARLVTIKPRSGFVLGGVLVPNGKLEYPRWFYHYAVEYSGLWYDEAYKDGIPAEEFKQRFVEREEIIFS